MRKKSSIALIISVIVGVVVIAGGIALATRISKLETTKTVGTFNTYEVGKLDQETGKGMTKSAKEECDDYEAYMHLKSYINADGLKVKVAEKATVEYRIYFYDDHYELVLATDWLDEDFSVADYSSSETTGIKYAQIEITPTADPDGIISSSEISTYAKMLTVTYNK